MAQIPLNKFTRYIGTLTTYTPNIVPIYVCPDQRATIILSIQCANVVNNSTETVTIGISSKTDKTLYYLVSGFNIPKNDAANMALGKVLVTEGDGVVAYCSAPSAVNIVLSLLEAFNAN
jgi:hypothetical protein